MHPNSVNLIGEFLFAVASSFLAHFNDALVKVKGTKLVISKSGGDIISPASPQCK